MTHEQRAKSIAQLVKFHENLTESNSMLLDLNETNFLTVPVANQAQRAASLPNLDSQLMKLYSVTSVSSDKRIADDTTVEHVSREMPDHNPSTTRSSITHLPIIEPSPRELVSIHLLFSN